MAMLDSLAQMNTMAPQLAGAQQQSINQTMAPLGIGRQANPQGGQKQPAKFNPAYFGIGLLPGLASAIAPQQTSNFFGGLKNFLFGGQESQFNPEQLAALQQLLSGGLEQVQNPYQGFGDIENYANQQFKQQTVPSLAERFTAMSGGALSSPNFASQLGQAGAGLSGQLAALRAQYGQQQQRSGLGQLGLGLQPNQTQNQGGFMQSLLPLLARAGGAYATGGLL